jgi:pSer/pThr/pTyr-binding forkhead associated (FHA) protein
MELRYRNADGTNEILTLTGTELTIGRSREADIVVNEGKVSRLHASIILWGGDYVIKDLGSRNGTMVNDKKIEVAVLKPGDRVTIGSFNMDFVESGPRPPNTIIRSIEEEMREGKGYKTIMKELVDESENPEQGSGSQPS